LSKYVFLTGAGSSIPYDYPSGFNLVERVAQILDEMNRVMVWNLPIQKIINYVENAKKNPRMNTVGAQELMSDLGYITIDCANVLHALISVSNSEFSNRSFEIDGHPHDLIKRFGNFCQELIDSRSFTIDRFLIQRSNKEFDFFGKFIICYFLYQSENKRLFGKYDWIESLINMHSIQPKNIHFFNPENFPKIYTFNYDLEIERTIYLHLISYWNVPEIDAVEIVNKLGVMHIYGQYRKFDGRKIPTFNECFGYCLDKINLIGSNHEQLAFNKKNFLSDIYASFGLYILGFGYDSENFEKIFGGFEKKNLLNHNYNQIFKIFSSNIGIRGTLFADKYRNKLGIEIQMLDYRYDVYIKDLFERFEPLNYD